MLTKKQILDWEELNLQLKKIKAKEMAMRKEIVSQLHSEPGTANYLIDGIELKTCIKLKYALNIELYEVYSSKLTEEEKESVSSKIIYSINTEKYENLPKDCLLVTCLTTVTPKAPTLTLLSKEED